MCNLYGVKEYQIRPGSAGTSTTGSICRQIFDDSNQTNVAFGIDKDLIIRFRNISIAINNQCSRYVNRISLHCKAAFIVPIA